jgi:hypothetical protein
MKYLANSKITFALSHWESFLHFFPILIFYLLMQYSFHLQITLYSKYILNTLQKTLDKNKNIF